MTIRARMLHHANTATGSAFAMLKLSWLFHYGRFSEHCLKGRSRTGGAL